MDDWQWVVNTILTIALTAVGWFARQVWDSVNALKRDLNGLEVRLPTVYVNKTDFRTNMDHLERTNAEQFGRIEKALDRIFDKLDDKVDK